MQIYEELVARGLIAQVTDEEEIKKMVEKDILEANKELTFYKRVQDTYITTQEFEINSTRKVIRSKVIERYNASKNK